MKIITRAQAKRRGLKFFFSGKPCKRGHISKGWTNGHCCIVCHTEQSPAQMRKLRKENPRYREKNRERMRRRRAKDKLYGRHKAA